jgi:hypothetical protein
MEELRAALVAATRALRAAETEAQEQAKAAAATGVRLSEATIAGELAELRQAAGDLHRAVAVLAAGPAGHGG